MREPFSAKAGDVARLHPHAALDEQRIAGYVLGVVAGQNTQTLPMSFWASL